MSFISHAQRISRHTFACAPPRHHYSQDMSNSKDEFPGLNGTFDEWSCYYCEVHGTSRAHFDAHINGKRHQKYLRFMAHPGRWPCPICGVIFAYEQELHNHSIGKDTQHQALSVYFMGILMVWCEVCNKPLYYSPQQHLTGKDHKARLLQLVPEQRDRNWFYLRRNQSPVTLEMQQYLSPFDVIEDLLQARDHTPPEQMAVAVLYARNLFEVAPVEEAPAPPRAAIAAAVAPIAVATTEEEYKEAGRVIYLANLAREAANALEQQNNMLPLPLHTTTVPDDHGAIMYDDDGNMVLMVYNDDGTPVLLPLDR